MIGLVKKQDVSGCTQGWGNIRIYFIQQDVEQPTKFEKPRQDVGVFLLLN
jgi:hypothetical protein